MRLTPGEYRRGVISWESPQPIHVRTRTGEASGEVSEWSDWLTDSTGSLVQSLPGTQCQLSLRSAIGGAFDPPKELRWEAERDNEVVTWLFD